MVRQQAKRERRRLLKGLAVPPPSEISELKAKAEAGDPAAQFALGRAYDDGNGVAQSDKSASLWYLKAAEQAYALAENSLGVMYREGRGVEQSKEQAVEWYKKAAKQKNSTAMFNLGTAYYNGDGVSLNDITAYAWFLLAQQYGSEPAQAAVKRMSAEVKGWQLSSALETVGEMYLGGSDLPRDYSEAINWYRKAAQEGDAAVQIKLAKLLARPEGAQNYQEARHWCEEAAKQMFSPGAFCVGLMYERGLGVEQNLPEAAKWFNQAAQLGNAEAMSHLAEMYWKGSGVKLDRISAYTFVLLASTANIPQAQQDKALYEKELNSKELEKARKRAADWVRQHPALALRKKTLSPDRR